MRLGSSWPRTFYTPGVLFSIYIYIHTLEQHEEMI